MGTKNFHVCFCSGSLSTPLLFDLASSRFSFNPLLVYLTQCFFCSPVVLLSLLSNLNLEMMIISLL